MSKIVDAFGRASGCVAMDETAPLSSAVTRRRLRPSLFSSRFVVVVLLALLMHRGVAIKAVVMFLRGKRLRAWNILSVLASEHGKFYSFWIHTRERQSKRLLRKRARRVGVPHCGLLVLLLEARAAPEATRRARDCLWRAFGDDLSIATVVATECDLHALKAALNGNESSWLLPLEVGDSVEREVVELLAGGATRKGVDFLYWDEDIQRKGGRTLPWMKPEWDPLVFAAGSGLVGASIARGSVLLECAADLAEGAGRRWLHDCLMRVAEKGSEHVPLILTHRAEVVAEEVAPCVHAPAGWPNVSVIIPTKDLPKQLEVCLHGLSAITYAGELEIIIVDNGSTDPDALLLIERFQNDGGLVLRRPGPFNFSALNNEAVMHAKGDVLCFLNNDIEPLDQVWLETLVGHALEPGVGAVGPKLLYPDGTIQHAGVAIGLGGAAGHVQRGASPDAILHRHWSAVTRRVSAVTGACLVTRKKWFLQVGGFDADAFPVAFNDVDLCLKLEAAGLENRYVAEVVLIHHESKSRGKDDTPDKIRRFSSELQELQAKWRTQQVRDRWFSPAFSLSSERCVLDL